MLRILSLFVTLVLVGPVWTDDAAPPKQGKPGKKTSSTIPVRISAGADSVDMDGKQAVTVVFSIDQGWHIYANPVENDKLTASQTVIAIASKIKLEEVKVDYPAGKPFKGDEGDYKIYADMQEIKAMVRRAKGDMNPLEVTVTMTAVEPVKKKRIPTANVKLPPIPYVAPTPSKEK